jgi:flagellar motor switch protein FliN
MNPKDLPDHCADEDAVDPALARFLDLPMRLTVELGRRPYRFGDALALREGAIVPLDRSAGENVELLLNGSRIGAGEIVVIEDSIGLRVTEMRGVGLPPGEPGGER